MDQRFLSDTELQETPGFTRLLTYFEDSTGGNRLPSRRDFRPADIKDLLPLLCMWDIETGPDGKLHDAVFRLMGTKVTDLYGEHTGNSSRDFPDPDVAGRIMTALEWIVANRTPLAYEVRGITKWRDYMNMRLLYIPMSDDGRTVNRAIGLFHFM